MSTELKHILVVESINAQGALSGKIFGQPIRGWWDEVSQTVTFMMFAMQETSDEVPTFEITFPQVYTGYLFSTPSAPPPGEDIAWTLAGFVKDPVGHPSLVAISSTSRRNEFGWLAKLTQVI